MVIVRDTRERFLCVIRSSFKIMGRSKAILNKSGHSRGKLANQVVSVNFSKRSFLGFLKLAVDTFCFEHLCGTLGKVINAGAA